MKADSLYGDVLLQGPATPERFDQMPGNGLSFPVGIGRENQAVCLAQSARDRPDALFRLAVNFPDHAKAVLRNHRIALLPQIPDVAVARDDLIVGPEIRADVPGLCRRFDNNDLHGVPATRLARRQDRPETGSEVGAGECRSGVCLVEGYTSRNWLDQRARVRTQSEFHRSRIANHLLVED